MIYLFAGFLVQLIWEFFGVFIIWFLPEHVAPLVYLVVDLVLLSLFLVGALTLGREKKHFKAAYVISIVLITTSCIVTVLEMVPVEIESGGLTDIAPMILGFVLTYQLIKGLIARSTNHPGHSSAKRLLTYFKTSLWLLGGLTATIIVGVATVVGTIVGGALGTVIDPAIFEVPDAALLELVLTDVLPSAGLFLIIILVVFVGLLLAYIVIRIVFVVTVYQLKNVKDPAQVAVEPLPAVE